MEHIVPLNVIFFISGDSCVKKGVEILEAVAISIVYNLMTRELKRKGIVMLVFVTNYSIEDTIHRGVSVHKYRSSTIK